MEESKSLDILDLDKAIIANKIYIYPMGLMCFVANLICLMLFNSSLMLIMLFSLGILLSLVLIFNELLSSFLRKGMSLLIIVPVFYLFPLQQLLALQYSPSKIPLYMYCFVGLVIILNIINRYTVLVWYFSSFLVFFLYNSLVGAAGAKDDCFILAWFFSMLFILSYIYFNSIKGKELEIQTQRLKLIGGSIAHELRTPLAAMISGSRGIQKLLPKIVEIYKKCAPSLDLYERIEEHQVVALNLLAKNMEKTGREASMVIDMFLIKIKGDHTSYTDSCKASAIVSDALDEYPLDDISKGLVKFNSTNDFHFLSNQRAMKHVMFNLLKNALYQIKRYKRGEILIWFEQKKGFNEIHFKDTAIGVPQEKVKYIFDNFYSESKEGTGLGLPFCKLVLEYSNGLINCESVHNEYVEFIMQFPRVDL